MQNVSYLDKLNCAVGVASDIRMDRYACVGVGRECRLRLHHGRHLFIWSREGMLVRATSWSNCGDKMMGGYAS